ncbi:hypothetical protein U8607_20080 [Methylobacterium durans]|uniref:hypothetical protein n=1 Tax=Methylobacterium durans TaxID=2202825 RepID=UPI002AFF829C|nr:hypothetical protein [Methylobacterium durans]MEA1834395.1 hypothetical protein [Methylobacterium durans]
MAVPALLASSSQIEIEPRALARARAIADACRFRALARSALRDGAPMAELRSSNARAAARRLLAHARTLALAARGEATAERLLDPVL